MKRLLEAVLRTDLRFFIRKVFVTVCPGEPDLQDNLHIEAIAYQLERVFLGETTRLLINQPPRSLKSICVSVAYFSWLLGLDLTRRVIVVSYWAILPPSCIASSARSRAPNGTRRCFRTPDGRRRPGSNS